MNETEYLLTHEPTIAEVRQLNRDGVYLFPLPMLNALIDAGVNIDTESAATIRQYPHTEDIIEMRYAVRLGGKLLAILGDGHEDEFRVIAKRKGQS